MTKFWWAPVDLGVQVRVRLCAVLLVGVAVVLAAPAVSAMSHPVRPAQARSVVAHSYPARRAVARTSGETTSSKARKNSARKPKAAARSAERATRPGTKSKHHKRHSESEADNDPIVLHRASGRAKPAPAPARKMEARNVTPQVERTVAADDDSVANQARSLTPEDFAHAPGASAANVATNAETPHKAETSEHGESHPDGDERLPLRHAQTPSTSEIVATVSAAPEPVTPAGKATLPEKLHAAAVKAGTAVAADAASTHDALVGHSHGKPSVMPEDHAGKVEVINEAMTPMILPTLYTRHGRLIVPPPMKGSWDILVHQNTMADSEGLTRIQDDEDLDRMRASRLLVPLTGSNSLLVNAELPLNRRYARPWAARFATDTAKAFYARFHQPLRLNSAVRTVEYQIRLQRVNGNAAAVDGDGASPHLTGQALDFGKRGMSTAQIAWMRAYLAPLMKSGKLDVEEEFQQACFHISVYRSYLPVVRTKPKGAPKMEVAQARAELPVRAVARVEPDAR